MKEVDNIELRSEEVRHIISEVPNSLVRYGILVIAIIVIGLFAASYFIPYPETVVCKAVAVDAGNVTISVPYRYINEIKKGYKVRIEFDGYPASTYNYRTGGIIEISKIPVLFKSENFFHAHVSLYGSGYRIFRKMSGNAFILISNETIFQHIIGL